MIKHLIIFGLVNLLSSILSGASGGGAGIISTPFMVLLGLPPATAIATAKFGGFGISLGSSSRFLKEKITDKRTVIIFSIIGGVGAIAGSLTLSHFATHTLLLQKLMAIAILVVGVPMLYVRKSGLSAKPRPLWMNIIGLILLGVGVFVQVALGSGVGTLQLIILISCFGMTAIVASATRRFMQLTVATISLGIFMLTGLVDYRYGVVGLITAFVGGYIGTHIAIKKGNKFVINLISITSVLLALQLLFG